MPDLPSEGLRRILPAEALKAYSKTGLKPSDCTLDDGTSAYLIIAIALAEGYVNEDEPRVDRLKGSLAFLRVGDDYGKGFSLGFGGRAFNPDEWNRPLKKVVDERRIGYEDGLAVRKALLGS